jgi:hypothetical protein
LPQRIDERHAERREVTLVGREDGVAPRGGGGGDGDILEAGIVGAGAVEDRPGVAGFLDAEWLDALATQVRQACVAARPAGLLVPSATIIAENWPLSRRPP